MKKITTKDIIILVIATVVIIGAGYMMWILLFPKAPSTTQNQNQSQTNNISTEIDQNTLKRIDSLSNYGQPTLDNIGKSNLFAN